MDKEVIEVIGFLCLLGSFLGSLLFWLWIYPDIKSTELRNSKAAVEAFESLLGLAEKRVEHLENKIMEMKDNESNIS